MNRKRIILMVILLVIVAIGVFFILSGRKAVEIEPQGDQGPDQNNLSGHESVTTKINQGASALGVKVVPLEVLEDSRCPIGAECIMAGTVRVKALLSSGLGEAQQIFELDKPITTESEIVTLEDVVPHPKMTRQGVEFGQYTFIFRIEKRKFLE